MRARIRALVIKLYDSNRTLIKETTASFLKAFVSVFIPGLLGIYSDLSKLGTGGKIHLSVLLSLILSLFIAALYAGVHAVVVGLNSKLKTTVGKS